MNYTKIKDLKFSKLTLGTVQLGMDYGIANKSGKPGIDKAFEILKVAVNNGVNSFDTASLYGNSEEVLGQFFTSELYRTIALKNQNSFLENTSEESNQPLLTTKFKIMPEDNLTSGSITDADIEKQIYQWVEHSLEKLMIKKIPIYMLHNAKDMTQYGKIVPETLRKLKEEGLIDKAGVSVYHPDEVEEMLKDDLYEAVQLPMNLFDQRMISRGIMQKLKNKNIIVFVRSVFLQGLFFLNPEKLPRKVEIAREPLLLLRKLSEEESMSIAQLAIAYIRDMEGVSSLVLGVETPEQITENIQLMDAPAISEKTRYEIESSFRSVPILDIMEGLK